MRLKSYFVHTMEEALQAAKLELGEDAMLVDSKRLDAPEGGRPRLEVIFAAAATPPPPPKVPAVLPPPRRDSVVSLQRFRGELSTLLDALNRNPDATRLAPLSPARQQLDSLRARLLDCEVPPSMIDEVLTRCRSVLEGLVLRGFADDGSTDQHILPLLAAEWPHAASGEGQAARVLAFVGPTGAGKTSAIAKLAFRLGVAQAKAVQVFSIDNLRIGASDQLAHICSLLGVPFQSLDFSGALPQALAGTVNRGIVLIDTPGYAAGDIDVMEETAGYLSQVGMSHCHLVLPATLRFSEMRRRERHFSCFAPSRLLFTRLDETEYFGPAWAFARQTRLAVDWVSTGPGIPEDIEEADASCMAAALLGNNPYAAAANAAQLSPNLASAATAGASRI